MKVKKLTVSFVPDLLDHSPYRVVRVEHTTEINPGDLLDKKTIDEYNASHRWHVVVIANK